MRAAIFLLKTLAVLFFLIALSAPARAQVSPASKVLIVSPHVGEVIDPEERNRFRLFSFADSATFQVARFMQTPENRIVLEIMLKNGRLEHKPYSQAEFELTGELIAARAAALNARQAHPPVIIRPVPAQPQPQAQPRPEPPAQIRRITRFEAGSKVYFVMLSNDMKFFGTIAEHQEGGYLFSTQHYGQVAAGFEAIRYMKPVDTSPLHDYWIPNAHDSRLFFGPTGRGLPKGEGYVQMLYYYLVSANFGITDNFSMGLMTMPLPLMGLERHFAVLTPKVSFKTSAKTSISSGIMYTFLFNRHDYGGRNFGVIYTAGSYGNANSHLTAGLGYGFMEEKQFRSPAIMVGGQLRLSNRIALMSENYYMPLTSTNSQGQEMPDNWAAGLYGLRMIWPKSNLDLGAMYLVSPKAKTGLGEQRVFSTYILPVYITYSVRLGNRRGIGKY